MIILFYNNDKLYKIQSLAKLNTTGTSPTLLKNVSINKST